MIAGWLEDAGADAPALLGEIPQLKRAHAAVLAPEQNVLGVYRIRNKETFDSSATPEIGTVMMEAPQGRASIDMTALEAKMGHALEAAQENDPEALRRRIRRLEQQLADGTVEPERVEVEVRVEVPTVPAELEAHVGRAVLALDEAQRAIREFDSAQAAAPEAPRPHVPSERREDRPAPAGVADSEPEPSAQTNGDGPALKAGMRRMLDMLARYGPLPRRDLAILSRVSPVSGTVSDYLSVLRQHALVVERDGRVQATDAGRALVYPAGDVPPGLKPEQVYGLWADDLKAGARRMVEHLMRVHPEGFTRRELAGLAGISPQSGTVSDYMSVLRRRGLVEERARRVYAGRVLYLWSER
jgi:hypothetical protein